MALAVLLGPPRLDILGEVTELDQDRGHVGRLEDGEPSVAARSLEQRRGIAEFGDQSVRELRRQVHGLALGQVDQDTADDIAFAGEVDPGDDVGAVFPFGQSSRLVVGGGFGKGIDRGATQPRVANRVGVQGQEEVAARVPGPRHPVPQFDEVVGFPSHDHAVAPGRQQAATQLETDGQRQVLLEQPPGADGAGVGAAMPRIEHHGALGLASERGWAHRRQARLSAVDAARVGAER